MAENTASDGFRSNFRGAAFCLPHQLVGILLLYGIDFRQIKAKKNNQCQLESNKWDITVTQDNHILQYGLWTALQVL